MDVKDLSWFQKWRIKYLNSSISAGFETRPGWPGSARFYFFRCSHCGQIVKDCEHGQNADRYFNCPNCEKT